MKRFFSKETYQFIEAKLHSYEENKRRIEEWELSVRYPERKQSVPGAGYISDPTANQAIKLVDPPKHIRRLMRWQRLIEKTQEYCRQNQNNIFDIWYGKPRQTITQAFTKNGIEKKTFENRRDSAVYFLLFHAIDAGLCRLNNTIKEDNAAL